MHTGVLYLSKYTLYFEILTRKKKRLVSHAYYENLNFCIILRLWQAQAGQRYENHEIAYCRQFPISLLVIRDHWEPCDEMGQLLPLRVYHQFLLAVSGLSYHSSLFTSSSPCPAISHLRQMTPTII